MADRVRSILKTKGSDVWAIEPDATVYDALRMMADKGVGALLVLDGADLVGIISERDYARKVILKDKSSRETQVKEIMQTDVVSVTPSHSVEECMRIMTGHRIRHLPVMEDGKLVGVVSIGDLVSAIISSQAATIDQLSSYIAGTYPR